jgi:hypothetical protein
MIFLTGVFIPIHMHCARKNTAGAGIEPGLAELSLKASNQLSHRFGS